LLRHKTAYSNHFGYFKVVQALSLASFLTSTGLGYIVSEIRSLFVATAGRIWYVMATDWKQISIHEAAVPEVEWIGAADCLTDSVIF
jgi:hypothetical protein